MSDWPEVPLEDVRRAFKGKHEVYEVIKYWVLVKGWRVRNQGHRYGLYPPKPVMRLVPPYVRVDGTPRGDASWHARKITRDCESLEQSIRDARIIACDLHCFQLTTPLFLSHTVRMGAGEFDFEIAFVTESLVDPADERIDRANDALPNLVVSFDNGLTVIAVLIQAVTAVSAGIAAAETIESSGIRVYRSYQDLVSRQDIADRANVTRQAVGNWVRGDRRNGADFPSPVSRVAGGAWLWGDVVAWLRSRHISIDAGVEYPSLVDHNRIDFLLASKALRSYASQKWFGIEAGGISVQGWSYGGSASGPRHAAQTQTMSVPTRQLVAV